MRFFRFLVTGGLAAVANIASRHIFSYVMPFGAAVTLAYLVGMAIAFVLVRTIVFDHDNETGRQLSRFVIVNAVALGIVYSVSAVLAFKVFPAIHVAWHAEDIAHMIGVGSTSVTSYLAHKHFTFSEA